MRRKNVSSKEKETIPKLEDLKKNPVKALKLTDMKLFEKKAEIQPAINEEPAMCQVCFSEYPDAVFMDCGHGGLCYQCSLSI